jgi:hypothetical protein
MTTDGKGQGFQAGAYCLLAAVIMAYGWGYRGTVGHEAGAMVPGAMLGLVLALASGRIDWQRRSVVVGLFAAAGWAWGGSLSYMEHTFYVSSDSFPDVVYGYAILFLLGGMWAGIGGAVLGLAFTESRSDLERFARPFTAICGVFLVVHLYLFFLKDQREALETLTVRHFHDGDWLAATIALIVSGLYWLVFKKDRSQTAVLFGSALAWWVGYLSLTKILDLRLAPLHRSENWGGVLGILVALLLFLARRRNLAALMLSLYGILGGGIGFVFAVFLRHPLKVQWGPIAAWPPTPHWRVAEVSFGFFMGLAIALGVLRLIRGGLKVAEEDTPRAPLDVYAGFAILVALIWVNFRRHAEPWLVRFEEESGGSFFGMPLWAWYILLGALATSPLLYALYRYLKGDRLFVPRSAFGKGAAVTLLLVWLTVAGYAFDDPPRGQTIIGHLVLWIPAALASWLLLRFSRHACRAEIPISALTAPSDPKWRVGVRYWVLCGAVPFVLLAITGMTMAMQDDTHTEGRKRFGPDAYWRQTERLMGTWKAVARAQNLTDPGTPQPDLPVLSLYFSPYRDVIAAFPSGELSEEHRWFLKNQYTWLDWYSKSDEHPERAQVPLDFREGRLYIAWPSEKRKEGYLVFERTQGKSELP